MRGHVQVRCDENYEQFIGSYRCTMVRTSKVNVQNRISVLTLYKVNTLIGKVLEDQITRDI
jgi:hypothetical protein